MNTNLSNIGGVLIAGIFIIVEYFMFTITVYILISLV